MHDYLYKLAKNMSKLLIFPFWRILSTYRIFSICRFCVFHKTNIELTSLTLKCFLILTNYTLKNMNGNEYYAILKLETKNT